MTAQQVKDFNKWLPCELDAYMDDNNIRSLADVSLARALEEAEWSKFVGLQWKDFWADEPEYKARYQGAVKFLKKYGGATQ